MILRDKTPADWRLVELLMSLPREARPSHVLLTGRPGSGKSFSAMTDGAPRGVVVVTLTQDSYVGQLLGTWISVGGDFVWSDGPCITAWRKGWRLVVNELHRANGDTESFLHTVLDDPRIARIVLPTGEVVQPSPGFECVATSNAEPEEIEAALLDRFDVKVEIKSPRPAALEGLPAALRNLAINSAKIDDADRWISFRSLIALGLLLKSVAAEDAIKLVFGRRAKEIEVAMKMGGVLPKDDGLGSIE